MSDETEDAQKRAQWHYRIARESWFDVRVRRNPVDPESAIDRQLREEYNLTMKSVYDEDTEAILAGEKRALMPMCMQDMLAMRPPEVTT